MADYIETICKYLIILVTCMYGLESVIALFVKKSSSIRFRYGMMMFWTFVIHFLGFLVLFLQTESLMVLFLYLAEFVFFLVYPVLLIACCRYANRMLLNHTIFFLAIGSVMLARLDMDKAVKQLVFIGVAGIATLIIPKYVEKLQRAKRTAAVLGVLGLLLLAAVVVVGRSEGTSTYGANLSLTFAGISVQPSEVVKVTFVFLIAMLFRKRNDFRRVVFATAIAVAHVGVLVLSKDLGGALIFFLAYMNMLYLATTDLRYTAAGFTAFAAAGTACYFLFAHVRTRIKVWIDPWSTITSSGYQVARSLFAIGAGGWFGTGIGSGKPLSVPVVTKDFIFSAIAEEMGGIVAMLLILICFCCLVVMLQIAGRMEVLFYRMIAVGLATVYGVQVVLTIGGALKYIPSTGVTLPLVSYGGSSIVGTFVMFSVLQGIFHRKQEEVETFEREKREEQEQRRIEEEKASARRREEEKRRAGGTPQR